MKLTETQQIASQAKGKNILVSAGAGTGKTRVLVERFLHYVTSGEALATEILALTFTEKAANEMKARIQAALVERGLQSARRDLESAYISTIHAFCARLLRDHPLESGVDPDFRVLETDEADFLKEQALDDVLDLYCQKGTPSFELLKVYGEEKIRDGIFKVFHQARHGGRSLNQFFQMNKKEKVSLDPTALFDSLGEAELLKTWMAFHKKTDWDWTTVEDFKAWLTTFSRKRGKKGDDSWKEVRKICRHFLAAKLESFAEPWQEKFRDLALHFEAAYETKKRERGFLDFDDLERCAIQLFKGSSAIHQKIKERYQNKFRQVMVDEFQDTSFLQLELVELLATENNLFLVGDYKQSIYGFRGAEPQLFLEKEKAVEASGNQVRIPLLENFRTEDPLLDWINRFFMKLWEEDDISYEALIARVPQQSDSKVELLLTRPEKGENLDGARLREAEGMAERMLELHEEGTHYGEMAVLFQAMKDVGIYEQALKKRGIPYYAMSSRGFYHQPEIRDMMSFLACLENPLADIPLAAVLRSPLFQVHDNTLFWLAQQVKALNKFTPLYHGLKDLNLISQIPESEKEKIARFSELYQQLLEIKDQLKLTELLDYILEKTAYELTMLADPQGIRRYANLKKLMNLAREFERFAPLTLGEFLKTVRRLESQEVRESEAQVEAEQSGNVVRLLSIHRAKGLQFPVLFIADLGRSRQSNQSKAIMAQFDRGFQMQVQNEVSLEWEMPLGLQLMDEAEKEKDRSEWKRLFYVALTRVQNRLIFSGVHQEKKKAKETFSEMSTWMDWIMFSGTLREEIEIRDVSSLPPRKRKRAFAERKDLEKIFGDFIPQASEAILPTEDIRRVVSEQGDEIFEGIAKHEIQPARSIDLPVSAYVLFDKSREDYRSVYEIGYPDESHEEAERTFEQTEEVSAADFGTQMHWVLERLDFRNPRTHQKALLEEAFRGLGPQSLKEAQGILEAFLKSETAKRLAQAKVVKREVPFILNERHGLIHGIIDVLFQDAKGKWIVLDYKTATGDTQKINDSHYEVQIKIYALAVSQLLNVPVESGLIYFLKNNWCYEVPFAGKKIKDAETAIRKLQEEVLQQS